jgi:hypothetical protein
MPCEEYISELQHTDVKWLYLSAGREVVKLLVEKGSDWITLITIQQYNNITIQQYNNSTI